jgi:hypothetical protein
MESDLGGNRPAPNPRRVAAGKLNRKKRGPLSERGRERLRAAIAINKPWLRSTGPKTPQGKERVAQNGQLSQKDRLSVRQARALLAKARSLLKAFDETVRTFGEVR